MTRETRDIDARAELLIDEVLWELELLDSDGVDAEFAAILIASGFSDRTIVAGGWRPWEGVAEASVSPERRPNRERDRRDLLSRVRSPPKHDHVETLKKVHQ